HSGVWHKASLAARRAGVRRLVHTDHGRVGAERWTERLLDQWAARRTDVVVAVSEALARQLMGTVVADTQRLRVVLNGVDTARFTPRTDRVAARRELGLDDDATPILGSVGRFDAVKRYDLMIEAFASFRAAWHAAPAPVLVMVGEGPEAARLAALVEAHRLQGAVRLLGWHDQVERLLAAFDVFTLSSRSEGTSVSLLEAMSAGVCPVVTDVGGNRAVLGADLRHRLVPEGDARALAAAWEAALADGQGRRVDGAAARRRVEQRFSLDAMVRAYERLYVGEADTDSATT